MFTCFYTVVHPSMCTKLKILPTSFTHIFFLFLRLYVLKNEILDKGFLSVCTMSIFFQSSTITQWAKIRKKNCHLGKPYQLFASKVKKKSTLLLKKFRKGPSELSKINVQKMLISAFEVIMQPFAHTIFVIGTL